MRGLIAGAVVGCVAAYLPSADAERFQQAWAEYQFGSKPVIRWTTLRACVGGAALGSSVGLLYMGASRVSPLPDRVTGALCGLALWATGEAVYRAQPNREQDWSAPPVRRAAELLVFGVEVSALAEAFQPG